ncbi:MAG: glycosyltransferase family 4 protein [Candidatus Sumerlaeia bacterium]|nr:glycosyltransferase family 4 protein [Candidatus Sumerlaeia bacterium]
MRVLVLNHNLREHGTYFRAWKVAQQLARAGHDVTFVTTSATRWYRADRRVEGGITLVESPNWAPLHHPDEGWSPLGLLERLRLAGSQRWDLVFSFSHRPVDQLPARLARRLHGARWVCDWCDLYGGEGINSLGRRRRGQPITFQDFLRDGLDHWDDRLERAAARDADLLTVISTDLGRRAVRLGRSRRSTHLMVSGADTDAIQPLDAKACRAELGLPAEGLLLGYIANYHPDERLLLDGFARVAAAREDIGLVAVGPPFYGGPTALRDRGIGHRVRHFGRVPFARIPVFLGAADILLVPMTDTAFNRSRWPNKIGDHLAAGRPQVAALVGDVRRFLATHDVGVGFEPTPEDFACAVLGLADDPQARARMGREARRVAETEFAWPGLVERLLAKALGRRATARDSGR